MLIEIHMLQNYAPSNLNRDETGSPKDCVFGGVRRGRISSQSLKRSIRRSEIFQTAFSTGLLGIRTRRLPEEVGKILVANKISDELVNIAKGKVTGFGNKDGKENADGITAQVMFLSKQDIQSVANVLQQIIKECDFDVKKFKAVKTVEIQKRAELKGYRPITPDIALFGRMITSPAFEDIQASMQVAHAISTHSLKREFDYYTAVDDLNACAQTDAEEKDDIAGAGMIGDVEYNSSLYYKYYSLDVDGIKSNLMGLADSNRAKNITEEDKEAAEELVKKTIDTFLTAAVFASPTGKQNSFAAHQLPEAILIEIRPKKVPVSYANAFLKPIKATYNADLMDNSIAALQSHVELLTHKFSLPTIARLCFSTRTFNIKGADICETFDELVEKVNTAISSGE